MKGKARDERREAKGDQAKRKGIKRKEPKEKLKKKKSQSCPTMQIVWDRTGQDKDRTKFYGFRF